MRLASCPAIIANRDGEQSGELQYAFSNTTPRSASPCKCGAFATPCP
jgi:hypothetical protein